MKGTLLSDTFEQLAELGQLTTKKAGQAAKNLTVGTAKKALETLTGNAPQDSLEKKEGEKEKQKNYTPLDARKLEEGYKKQDEEKMASLRQRLFQLVKGGEQQVIEERKKEEKERNYQEKKEAIEKEKKKEEQKKKGELVSLPKGKVRKSIFAPQKIAKRQHMETRVGAGKQ